MVLDDSSGGHVGTEGTMLPTLETGAETGGNGAGTRMGLQAPTPGWRVTAPWLYTDGPGVVLCTY